MDTTSDLGFNNMHDKNISNGTKNVNSLHDTIDKVAEKAKPAIDRLAQTAHIKVERLAFQGAQLEDAYRRYLENSKNYIQSHPLMTVGTVFVLSFALSKLMCTRHK
jgi:ElaB/YqjD/DUF883 family membrane-anchored ribosome-binding protein